jgi:PHS family inorganic phosphate transporter-like MFS transporter
MMAGVFLMQPIGQLAACLVGLGAVMGIGYTAGLAPGSTPPVTDRALQSMSVDTIWRVVIGVGAFPALVAILFRITIPESPRFTLDVEHDGDRALEDTQMYFPSENWDSPRLTQGPLRDDEEIQGQPEMTQVGEEHEDIGWPTDQDSYGARSGSATGSESQTAQQMHRRGNQFTWAKIKQFFWTEGNWRYLAGTCLCW